MSRNRLLPLLALLLAACPGLDEDGEESPPTEEHEEDFHWPETEGNTDPGIPGWMGRTRISTTAGCWSDTDGVTPGVAGCHTLHSSEDACGTCDDTVLERIGEACYTFTHRTAEGETHEKRMLVETNPGAELCHNHAGGVGHPDVFDCELFCLGSAEPETGTPYSGGSCEVVLDDNCPGGPQESAACVCVL